MTGLTQKQFSALLRDAQAAFGVTNEDLAERTGIDVTTISRYRSPTYKSGPPSVARRGMMERAIEGLPEGYLSGTVGVTGEKLRRLALQRPAKAPNGNQVAVSGSEGAKGSDEAIATVSASFPLAADMRPPMGEAARQELEHRIAGVLERGAPFTREEMAYWLKLVRWAATPDGRDEAAVSASFDAVETGAPGQPVEHPPPATEGSESPTRVAEG